MRTSLALPLLALVGALASPGRVLAQKEFGFDNRKGSGQPYLTPAETVAKFKVADEFEVKLFAGEPAVVNPVAFTIDEKGRIWVVECFEYPKRTPKGQAPRDRIVILEDTDGDGVSDTRTVFAEGKHFPVPEERAKAGLGAFDLCTGIEVGYGGVFVGAAPYLWFIENKDDKPGKFEVLLKGFGSQDTHETLNTFQWGPDGWLYGLHGIFTNSAVRVANPDRKGGGDEGQLDGAEARINGGIWRYHPTQKKFEVFAEGTSNPWGMDWRNTDGQFILACCVIPHLYHIVPGGIYQRQAGASFHPHAYSYLKEICDHTFHKESGWAHAGLISLDVPHMPERFRNSVIFGSIHGCSLKQNVLKPNGSTYTASRGDDFLVSGDKNFRPINMKWGPNGDIFLIDWHDQNPCHQTQPDLWDYERGRVYRIQLKGTKTKVAEDLGRRSPRELLKTLADSKNPYEVRTAMRLLSALPVRTLAKYAADELPKSFQEWGRANPLPGLSVRLSLADPLRADPDQQRMWASALVKLTTEEDTVRQRAWGTRVLSEVGLSPALLVGLAEKEPSPVVRRELASAATRLADKHDVTPLLRALMAHKEDAKDPVIPQLVWLAYEKVLASGGRQPAVPAPKPGEQPANAGRSPVADELAWLAEQSPDNIFVRDQIVPKVMRRLVATGKPDDLKLCVEFAAKLKDANSREKALDGLAVALDKQSVAAPAGWAALQAEIAKENNPKLVALANKLAVSFRDPAAIKRALAAAANTQLPPAARIEAVQQLAVLQPPEALPLLTRLVGKSSEAPDALRTEGVRALAAFDNPIVVTTLIGGWKDFPPAARAEAVNTLASRKDGAKALLAAMAAKTVDRTEVTDNTITRIQAFNDKELNTLIERSWGRTRPTPAELNKLIDKTRDSLYAAPASFARGKLVFETNCGKCHKFEGKGNEVGPVLDGAGRDIEYILGNVLDPNRVIGAPYFVRTVRTNDDVVYQGLLAEEDEVSITLKLEGAAFKTIKKSNVAEVRVAEKSLMPEGLGYNMTEQNFRDLVRYLMANPFVTDATVNGEKLAAGVPGRLLLPDTKGAPAVVEAEVTSAGVVKTKLLVGSSADYEVRLGGQVIGTGKGTGKQLRPDQDAFDVTLPAGKHTLAVVVKNAGTGNALHARFLDPDRKLSYPDAAAPK